MNKEYQANVFAALLYPPVGKPRVIELPPMPKGMSHGCKTFKTKLEAETALDKFLTDNPEYRRWIDGSIQDKSVFVKFIVIGSKKMCGYWGQGDTLEEAIKQYKKAGGLKSGINSKFKFTASLPFAPNDRLANDDESDAYMDKGGSLNWKRCEREEIV